MSARALHFSIRGRKRFPALKITKQNQECNSKIRKSASVFRCVLSECEELLFWILIEKIDARRYVAHEIASG